MIDGKPLILKENFITRGVETMTRSNELFADAQSVIPGGVNSPVRAFKSVGGEPLFIKKASGCTIEDVDGKSYIDYVGSWGLMIVGHAGPVGAAKSRPVFRLDARCGRTTQHAQHRPFPASHPESLINEVGSLGRNSRAK